MKLSRRRLVLETLSAQGSNLSKICLVFIAAQCTLFFAPGVAYAQARGNLEVSVETPDGGAVPAIVLVDDSPEEIKAPVSMMLSPGKHHLIVNAGKLMWRGEILIREGRVTHKVVTVGDPVSPYRYTLALGIGPSFTWDNTGGGSSGLILAPSVSAEIRNHQSPIAFALRAFGGSTASIYGANPLGGWSSGYNGSPPGSEYHELLTSYTLSTAGYFYLPVWRSSGLSRGAVPREGETYGGLFVGVDLNLTMTKSSTTYSGSDKTINATAITAGSGFELGAYSQLDRQWGLRAWLVNLSDKAWPSPQMVNATTGFVSEVSFLLGVGPSR